MESDNFRKWVIAAHLVANQNFSDAAIRNEFLLIGIVFVMALSATVMTRPRSNCFLIRPKFGR